MLHAVVVWQGNGSTIGLFHPFRDWSTLSGKIPDKWKTDNRFPLISWWKPATDGRTDGGTSSRFVPVIFPAVIFKRNDYNNRFFSIPGRTRKKPRHVGRFPLPWLRKNNNETQFFVCVEWSCAIFPRLFANLCLPALSGGITICSREPSQFSRSFVPSIALPS